MGISDYTLDVVYWIMIMKPTDNEDVLGHWTFLLRMGRVFGCYSLVRVVQL